MAILFISVVGFYFSVDEPTALVQREGGPCAVIAAVQAFILKQLLLESDVITWKAIKVEKCDQLLVKAMTEIINQAADIQDPKYSVVHANDSNGFVSGKGDTDSKATKPTVNPAQNSSEGNQINETQATKQTSLESEVFHSQLRYVYIERYCSEKLFNRIILIFQCFDILFVIVGYLLQVASMM